MNNSPQCDADPACSDGRSALQQLVQARNTTFDAQSAPAIQNLRSAYLTDEGFAEVFTAHDNRVTLARSPSRPPRHVAHLK